MLQATYRPAPHSRQKAFRLGLLSGAALLPMTGTLLVTQRATAQTVISTSTGVQSWTSGDFTVTSTGSISGGSTAITATPAGGNLANSGMINGSFEGVANSGAIGTLNNNNGISGSYADISNATGASIGAFTNTTAGSLAGGFIGVNNAGSIATLSNSGSITGTGAAGINNNLVGTIGQLTNAAGGTLEQLVNNDTISGATAVALNGAGTTLINHQFRQSISASLAWPA